MISVWSIMLAIASCDPSMWLHVYHPQRLQIIDQCATVSGVIEHRRVEADGDWHIQLRLDKVLVPFTFAEQEAWKRNIAKQHSDLVIEPVCVNRVVQRDAITACRGARRINVPPVGAHVRVTGPLVIDNAPNHGWLECHAPSVMEIIH